MENRTNKTIRLEDLAYDLPEELIAQEPLATRHASRLLKIDRTAGSIEHRDFSDVPGLLSPGDLIVVNDTRVMPSKLYARRKSGGLIQILLLKARPERPGQWEAMASPMRRLKAGETLIPVIESDDPQDFEIRVMEIFEDKDGYRRLLLDLKDSDTVHRLMKAAGLAPLPPYIWRREPATSEDLANVPEGAGAENDQERKITRTSDLERYQTIFAREEGAVAAPTAGLHFSEKVLQELDKTGIELATITLHVGAGTFKPITTSIEEHTVESERFTISPATAEAVNRCKRRGNRVIAVGTTSLRALETAGSDGKEEIVPTLDRETDLYIRPGFDFKIADALITNFHLSGSSLLVLVAAFAGPELTMRAYREAVEQKYRFFSYGDAMLIT